MTRTATGVWNRLEWMQIVEEYQIVQLVFVDAVTYVHWAMDPSLPAREDIDIGLDLPDGDGTDWDYSHLPQATMIFNSAPDLPVEVRILDPPGREDVPVPIGQPVDIPLGAELLITIAGGANSDWFYTWDAPGNMIDGSGEKTERFRLMSSATIAPVRRAILQVYSFQPPQDENDWIYSWSGVGPYGHLVGVNTSTGLVEVPQGAFLRLRASKIVAPPAGASTAVGPKKTSANTWVVYESAGYGGEYSVYGTSIAVGGPYLETIAPVGTMEPQYGWIAHTATCSTGGSALIGAQADGGYIAPVCYESATVPGVDPSDAAPRSLVVDAAMEPGYEIAAITGNPGHWSGLLGAQNVTVEGVEMQKLEVKVEVDGGNGTPAEAGHTTADEAKRWYSNFGTELVQLDAAAHIGYYFTHWSGDGVAYPESLLGGPALGNPMPLDNPDNPVTDPSIWVAMGEESGGGGGAKAAGSADGGGSRKVEAEMKPKSALIVEGGGWFIFSTDAAGALLSLGYPCSTFTRPSVEQVQENIKTNHIFVFNGHADMISISIDYPDVDFRWQHASASAATPHPNYLLVYLNACETADFDDGASWKSAFVADCFIGWHGKPSNGKADSFDTKFWQRIALGDYAQAAVTRACYETGIDLYTDAIKPVCKGNVLLKYK